MDLDKAAVEAAAKALWDDAPLSERMLDGSGDWPDIAPAEHDDFRWEARIVLTAAAPLITRAMADAIADKIEAERPHIPPSHDQKRRDVVVQRSTLNQAARIARSHGSQAQTTEDGQ